MTDSFKYSYKTLDADALTLTVTNAGIQKCEPLHQWGPGVRTNYLIHHITAGKGYYTAGGVTYSLRAGDTFMIYPDEEIAYHADEDEPWEYCWVGFTGTNAAQMTAHTDFSHDCPVISTDFGNRLSRAISHIYKVHGDTYCDRARMTGYLYVVLSILMENSSGSRHVASSADTYAMRAAEYIRFNYSQPITVEDIADYIGVSRSHLYRSFLEHFSVSPKDYLSAVRISAACDLLSRTDLSVGTIANSVGFSNQLYFSTAFKKLRGMTPTQYRQQ